MTSKESLQFIIDTFNEYANKPDDIGLFFKFCGAHEQVKKDLEILDILKCYIEVEYDNSDGTYWLKVGKYGRTLIDKEKYNALKEWLKNV